MKAYIRSTGSYVPENRISNEDLSRKVDTSHEWIVSHTGIHSRHIADPDQAASDLAYKAAERALAGSGLTAADIDLILVATATPDFPGFPSTACIVQDLLGAENAAAMDIAAACTGFAYGLETARSFIVSGSARNVLLIGSEVFSRILNWNDRNTCVLFGDGAGAVIVSACEDDSESGIIDSFLRSEGSGARALERTGGGSRFPLIPGESPEADYFLKMDGRKVYNFAVRAICDTISLLLQRNGISIHEIEYIVPHQANVRIIDAAAKRFQIPPEKFYMNIQEYANTSGASIPLAMDEMNRKGLLRKGSLMMTVGFGGGLTYGGNIFTW